MEVYNRTLEQKIAKLRDGTKFTWHDVYPDAVDIINATPLEACSDHDGTTATISPAETFLGRALTFLWERPELKVKCEKLKPSSMGRKLATKELLTASREEYQKKIEDANKNANNKLRIFAVGAKVLKNRVTWTNKKDNKIDEQFEGPYEVVEVGESGADYKIQRIGTKKQPGWRHVDDIKAYEEDESVLEDSIEMSNAKLHAKKYVLKIIVGERGKTSRTKLFKILWSDASTTWDPAGNLDNAALAIKDWGGMHTEEQTRIMEMSDEQLNDWYDDNDDSVPLADVLSVEADVCLVQNLFDVPWGEMIDHLCKQSGISKEQIGFVFASPPCETFSSADASNISRDNFHREHNDPTKPPRKLEGCTNPAATAT